jgi:hypothetical protein
LFCSSIAVDLKLYLSSSLFPSDNKRGPEACEKIGREREREDSKGSKKEEEERKERTKE